MTSLSFWKSFEVEISSAVFITVMLCFQDRKGILFICGDHGMRDAGGHGGATPAEVLVPLVVVKSSDFVCPHP